MPSFLRATAKAVSKIAGPVAFPLDFLVSLRDDEQTERRQKELFDKLSNGEKITAEILAEMIGLKSTQYEIHGQLFTSFQCLLNLMVQQQSLLENIKIKIANREDEDEIVNLLVKTGNRNKNDLERKGLLTEDVIASELAHLFQGQIELFNMIISDAGYPMGSLKHSRIERVHFHNAIVGMRGLMEETQLSITSALAKEKGGSEVLEKWTSLFNALSGE